MTAPDLIVVNADICTMDPLAPRVAALAITHGRISALGTTAEIAALAGKSTRLIDAGWRLVLPGFQDTHIHLQDGGFVYSRSAILDTCTTIAELQQTLRNFAGKHKGEWLNGTGWYTGVFTDHNLNRYVLDAAVPDRPCYIVASDGHNACLNSKACALVGLRRGTPDPVNGHFVLDANGEPTGMLHESATGWAESFMPVPTDEDYANGVRFSQALCNRHGITGVIDASVNERHARVYDGLEKAGALTVRVRSEEHTSELQSPC